uniref:Putative acetyltransferase n=1 Tax=viral metagenome TaxID=1070528 RepID=A0A6M3ID35_9ZZZZ
MKCSIERGVTRIDKVFREFEAFNKDGKSIGMADVSVLRTDKKFLWIHELQVQPECRNKGVGTEIIGAIVDHAKELKADLIYTFPMTPTDEPNPIDQKKIEHFYKKNGFVSCNAPEDVATVTDEGLKKRGLCLKLTKADWTLVK